MGFDLQDPFWKEVMEKDEPKGFDLSDPFWKEVLKEEKPSRLSMAGEALGESVQENVVEPFKRMGSDIYGGYQDIARTMDPNTYIEDRWKSGNVPENALAPQERSTKYRRAFEGKIRPEGEISPLKETVLEGMGGVGTAFTRAVPGVGGPLSNALREQYRDVGVEPYENVITTLLPEFTRFGIELGVAKGILSKVAPSLEAAGAAGSKLANVVSEGIPFSAVAAKDALANGGSIDDAIRAGTEGFIASLPFGALRGRGALKLGNIPKEIPVEKKIPMELPKPEEEWVHGTTQRGAESIAKEGKFRIGERQNEFSELGPEAVYVAKPGSEWIDVPGKYEKTVPAILSKDANVVRVRTLQDVEGLAKRAGYDDVTQFRRDLTRYVSDPKGKEVSQKLRESGVDAIYVENDVKLPMDPVLGIEPSFATPKQMGVLNPEVLRPKGEGIPELPPFSDSETVVRSAPKAPKIDPRVGAIPKPLFDKGADHITFLDKKVTNWVDDLDPLLQVQRVLQSTPEYADNPWVRFKLLRGVGGKIQAELEERLVQPLREIAKKDNLDEFLQYAQAKREVEKGLQKGEPVVARPLAESEATVKLLETPERQAALKNLVDQQNWSLREMKDSGLISEERLNQSLENNQWYVPFFRELPESSLPMAGEGGRGWVRRLRGSPLPVKELMENMMKNMISRIKLAETNRAYRTFTDWALNTPGSERFVRPVKGRVFPIEIEGKEFLKQLPESEQAIVDPEEIFKTFRMAAPRGGPGRFTVWKEGKSSVFEVTKEGEELWKALDPFPTPMKSVVLDYLRPMNRMLRLGATSFNVDWMSRNIIRDTAQRLLTTSGSSIRVIPDTVRGVFDVLGKTPIYREWQRAGGSISGMIGQDIDTYRRLIRTAAHRGIAERVKDVVKHPFESLQALAQAMEEASRVAEFKSVPRRNVEETLRAAVSSRDAGLDFARAGQKGRQLNEVVAFFNAGMQDLSKIKRTLQEAPVRTMARGVAWFTLPTMAEWALNRDNPFYKNIPPSSKALYWWLPMGPDPKSIDDFFILPKPFLWGTIFTSPIQESLDFMDTKSPKEAQDLASEILATGVPNLSVSGITPWAVFLGDRGYDIYRQKPILTAHDLTKEPWLRYDENTSAVSKLAGRGLRVASQNLPKNLWVLDREAVSDAIQVSPKQLDAFLSQTTAGGGRMAIRGLGVLGKGLEKAGVIPEGTFLEEEKKTEKRPVLSGLVRRGQGWIDVKAREDFYRNLDRAKQARGTLKEMNVKGTMGMEDPRRPVYADQSKELQREATGVTELMNALRQSQDEEEKKMLSEQLNTMFWNSNERVQNALRRGE